MKVRNFVEDIARARHGRWMSDKVSHDITTWRAPWGDEQMLPWEELSERVRDYNRKMVIDDFEDYYLLTKPEGL